MSKSFLRLVWNLSPYNKFSWLFFFFQLCCCKQKTLFFFFLFPSDSLPVGYWSGAKGGEGFGCQIHLYWPHCGSWGCFLAFIARIPVWLSGWRPETDDVSKRRRRLWLLPDCHACDCLHCSDGTRDLTTHPKQVIALTLTLLRSTVWVSTPTVSLFLQLAQLIR